MTNSLPAFGLLIGVALLAGCAGLGETPSDDRDTDNLGPLDFTRHTARDCKIPVVVDGDGRVIDTDAHILAVNSRGYVVDLSGEFTAAAPPEDYRLNAVYEKTLAGILKQYKHFREANGHLPNRIVVYLNGGLNGECFVRKQAAEQVPLMLQDGIFPVFLAWSTGAFETYFEQIAHVRRGRYRHETLWHTAPIHGFSNVAEGFARLPTDLLDQWTRYENTAFNIHEPTFFLHENYKWRKDKCLGSRCNVLFVDPCDNDYSLPNFFLYTALSPVRGIVTPFVSGIGRSAWRNMLRRSRVTVHWPDEFRARGDCPRSDNQDWGCARGDVEDLLEKYPKGLGGFARLFHDFDLCFSEEQDDRGACDKRNLITRADRDRLKNAEVTLIGHSMGTIVLHELLPVFPGLVKKINNIVYMAAASRIRDTALSIIPLLQNDKNLKFYNLMLHPLADAREPVAFTAAPSGSLLEWIDEMYESPETVLDRTFGKWRNIRIAKHIFPRAVQSQMTFKVFSPKRLAAELTDGEAVAADIETNPITHGGFNDTGMLFWRPSFWGDTASVGSCHVNGQ